MFSQRIVNQIRTSVALYKLTIPNTGFLGERANLVSKKYN